MDRPRKTARGRWLIELASVEGFLSRLYTGATVPPGMFRYLRRRAVAIAA
jgi:hypothetical protein